MHWKSVRYIFARAAILCIGHPLIWSPFPYLISLLYWIALLISDFCRAIFVTDLPICVSELNIFWTMIQFLVMFVIEFVGDWLTISKSFYSVLIFYLIILYYLSHVELFISAIRYRITFFYSWHLLSDWFSIFSKGKRYLF